MQGSLTALALDPQVAVLLLVESEFLLTFDINLFYLVFAVDANYLLVSSEQVLAA